MANFINKSITDNGRLLLADVQAGAIFVATKIVIGSGNIPTGKTAATMTEVVTPVKAMQINKVKRQNDGTVVYGGAYSNEDVTTAFYFRELALYARAEYRDSTGKVTRSVDECLYSYGNAGATADYMPPYSASTVIEKQIDIVAYVGNDSQVDVTLSSGMYMTREQMDEILVDFAKQADIDGLSAKIGTAGDTGGSSTAGSLFAKLNKLLTDWTTARAAKVDAIDTNATAIKNTIGQTADTGGTATSGTLTAKVNEVITWLKGTLLTTVDNIWAETQKNNTANATGTLSQKLSKVIADISGLNTTVSNSAKYPVTKTVIMDLNGFKGQTVTVLNITGAGSIVGMYTNNFDSRYCTNIQVVVDGVTTNYAPQSGSDTLAYAGMGKYSGGFVNTSLSSIASLCSWNFKSGFKMSLTLKDDVSTAPFRATYDVYQ